VAESTLRGAQGENLLEVDDLCVTLFTDAGELPCIQNLSFVMRRGETLAVVGESGCGKSMTALSIMNLIPKPPAKIVGGAIRFEGTDLVQLSEEQMRSYRGDAISMIFQEPMTSLNPVMLCGKQIAEGLLVHNKEMSKQEADERALEMIKFVGIPAPEKVAHSYPFELSGGMRQRIMIAMALACSPAMLICDEPTTALDVTIQAQVLQLIDKMREETNTAVMLITHDMGVVSEMADWVLVMYAGRQVEYTRSPVLFKHPAHPYTQGLIDSIPSMESSSGELYAIPGNVPMLSDLPSGCLFHPRCPHAKGICTKQCPRFTPVEGDENHQVACWMYTDAWKEA
jgi:peptide/nickel transport system ATP-binding protein/oligopeptide transport system ATP-binding protein